MRYLTLDLSRESKSRATSEMCCHSVVISLLFDDLMKDWLQKQSSLSRKRKGCKKKQHKYFQTVALSPVALEFVSTLCLVFFKSFPWVTSDWLETPSYLDKGSSPHGWERERHSSRGAIQPGFLCCQVDRAFTWDPTSIVESIFRLVGQKYWLVPRPCVLDRLLFYPSTIFYCLRVLHIH